MEPLNLKFNQVDHPAFKVIDFLSNINYNKKECSEDVTSIPHQSDEHLVALEGQEVVQ